MGKRGPAPGTKYTRRLLTAGDIVVSNNQQLVNAQHFCDHLDAVLKQIERREYPADLLAPHVAEKLHEYTEAVQSSVIEGIERFYNSD